MGMDGMDGMGMGGMMLVWGLVGVALLILAVVGIWWLVRRTDNRDQINTVDSPEEILRRRYAAGELDEDEYLRRRSGLEE